MSRSARVQRTTKESDVLVELELDGVGNVDVETGVPFYDHMLAQLGKHAGFDLHVRTKGDVEVDERFVASRASGGEGLDAILSRRPDVTAICCLADVLALGVLDAAGRRGLRVAQDLTVTGFDDIPESAGAGLTTVHQPLGLKGREAGRLLLERLAEAAPGRAVSGRHPRRVLLPAIIQVRRSSGPVTERSTS